MTRQFLAGRAVAALILAQLIQVTWLARVQIGGVHTDLPLLVAVSLALIGGSGRGVWSGLLAGLLTGYGAGWHIGSFVVSRTAAASAIGFFPRGFSTENPLAPPLCAVAGTLLADLTFLLMSPTNFAMIWWLNHALFSCLLNGVVMVPLHWILRRLVAPSAKMLFA